MFGLYVMYVLSVFPVSVCQRCNKYSLYVLCCSDDIGPKGVILKTFMCARFQPKCSLKKK